MSPSCPPLIPANAGTQIMGLAVCGFILDSARPERFAPYDLGPGIRRDQRNRRA